MKHHETCVCVVVFFLFSGGVILSEKSQKKGVEKDIQRWERNLKVKRELSRLFRFIIVKKRTNDTYRIILLPCLSPSSLMHENSDFQIDKSTDLIDLLGCATLHHHDHLNNPLAPHHETNPFFVLGCIPSFHLSQSLEIIWQLSYQWHQWLSTVLIPLNAPFHWICQYHAPKPRILDGTCNFGVEQF